MASNGTMGLISRSKAGFKRKDLSPTQQKRFDIMKKGKQLNYNSNKKTYSVNKKTRDAYDA